MSAPSNQGRQWFSWLVLCLMFALCAALGILQYRWIGEVSVAARERLHGSLQASLMSLSRDFDDEIRSTSFALMPPDASLSAPELERQLEARFQQWRAGTRHPGLLRTVVLFVHGPHGADLVKYLDMRTGLLPPGPGLASLPAPLPRGLLPQDGFSVLMPAFGDRGRNPAAFGDARIWIGFELDPRFVRGTLIPELVRRHLGSAGESDYQVTVVTRATPPTIVYESDPGQSRNIAKAADASVSLFEDGMGFSRMGPPPGFRPGGPPPDRGAWRMSVRHRAGSLEAVVSRTRRANLAVTAVVLLLMMATVAALVRYTRRAQRLAELQMDFVAGVSHELRTPLTVIHTAAYNLQGKLASQPQQVERYGALIQKESGRLKTLVEQILRFGGIEAGRVIEATAPVSIEGVIDAALENTKPLIESSRCTVEKRVAAGLPKVLGDAVALQHVLTNLIGNAAKYGLRDGSAEDRWIGVSAAPAAPGSVEIRVADRGPGIAREERDRIFDPFFRGAHARNAQTHGTGLGLSISKKIVEAHRGTISVNSQPMQGAEFTVRLPVAPGLER
jgi:signal transduction histidine kinase